MIKKILTIIIGIIITIEILAGCDKTIFSSNLRVINENPVKVGVLLSNFNDLFISLILQSFEKIQTENEGKIEYTFFDGKGNQNIQNEELNSVLEKNEFDYLVLNLVDQKNTQYAIDRIKENNISVITIGGAELAG